MATKDALKKLRTLGYDRSEEYEDPIQYGKETPKKKIKYRDNCSEKTINHTILEHHTLRECNYAKACVTGSIFRFCKFVDCSLYQADFEFCEFYDCEFQCEAVLGASFNNSSFINTKFIGVNFQSCTFTGALFQTCLFDRGQISVCTLENALFRDCDFEGIDYRNLNMDYIELDTPHMNDAVLPLDQIPFMFGALQYLMTTKDAVSISEGNKGRMTPTRFFEKVVPLLCTHFEKSKQFFPLANIYYAIGDNKKANKAIKDGLITCMAIRDFRMLKYFCKLIAYSGVYQPSALHNLYNNYICRLYPQNSANLDIPNYAHHILEIKSLLFGTAKRASIRVAMKTDILLSDNHKLGKLFESIFSLGKLQGIFQSNDIEAVLQQNSPLIITVRVSGDEAQLYSLLQAYLTLGGICLEDQIQLPVVSQYHQSLPVHTNYRHELFSLSQAHRQELLDCSVHVTILEYYVDNFRMFSSSNDSYYYFNGNAIAHENVLQ